MKKTLFAALALAFVASCSNEEVVEMAQKEAISFDKTFVNNSTRSVVDPSYTNEKLFSDFAVFGFVENNELFNGTQVKKGLDNEEQNIHNSEWKYTGTQYWIAGANYNFAAVAPYTNPKWTKTSASTSDVVLSFTNDGTQDLVYAKTDQIEGKASGNVLVGFTFNHALSKVKFSFENLYYASNATIKVKDIQITNAFSTANVTLTKTAVWADQGGNELTLNFGNATADDAESDEALAYASGQLESYNELLLIPGKPADGYIVKFKVELYIGNAETAVKSYNHEVTITNFTPEAGKAYDILAKITPENIDPEHKQEPIEFTVTTLNGWGNPEEVSANN